MFVVLAFSMFVLVVDAVIFVAKRFVKKPVVALKRFAKKFDVVAFVIEALFDIRFVMLALVPVAFVKIRLSVFVVEALIFVIVALVNITLVPVARPDETPVLIVVVETLPFTIEVKIFPA